jgi:SAM-dependent methyltransferase
MHAVAAEVLADSEVVLHHVSAEKFKSNRKFDVVLSHLCGHVVADLDSFFRSCAAFVAPSGSFILSLPHPCFWNEYRRVFPTEDYRYMQEAFASTTLYITKDPNRPIEAMPFHHRPLSRYLNALHGCGMALKSLDEIVPSKAVQAEYDAEWLFPRYCVLHAVHLRH